MKFTQNTKGFTLIELLVVITIIGILAVGGTATYTAQIQKARDSTRMTDLNAIRSGVEQFYQDYTEYPTATVAEFTGTGAKSVSSYVPKIPKDIKAGQTCGKGKSTVPGGCDYVYNVGEDVNGIANGRFRVSTAFENAGNVDTKAAKDGGREDVRLELWIQLKDTGVSTNCKRSTKVWTTETSVTRVIATTDCAELTSPDEEFPTSALLISGNN